ncbi:MAG: TetR/AcrR family transcriptional regulator [candidate division NC10 bacterium]|nr:TetR/AcrR family transcriptional regulator [candidate division NC10 bacterium]
MPPVKRETRSPRWQRRPEIRPQQILDAAFRVFGTRGLHQATLDDVARAAGITKGTIYLYFPSKAALFSAMLKARVNDLLPPMEPANGGRSPSTHRRLLTLAQRLYRFFQSPAYLAMYRTMVGEASQFPGAAALLYREGILPANRRLAEVIQHGIAAGEFRKVDPLIASRAFVGMFQVFVVSQELLGGRRIFPIPDQKVIRTITDVFFRGLLAPRRGAPRGRRPRGAR